MTRSLLLSPAFAALLFFVPGCGAGQSDASSKRLNELGEQIRRLQATTDRLQERLSAIENVRAREAGRASREAPTPSAIPELPVVKLQADSGTSQPEPPSATAEGNESRPLIYGEGSRVETRTGDADLAGANSSPRRSKDKPAATTSKRSNVSNESGKKSP